MPKVKQNSAAGNATPANVGDEAELWQMDDAIAANLKELGFGS